jgi:hypothetical protein
VCTQLELDEEMIVRTTRVLTLVLAVAASVPLFSGSALAGVTVSGSDGQAKVTVYQPTCTGSPETDVWVCYTVDESATVPVPHVP